MSPRSRSTSEKELGESQLRLLPGGSSSSGTALSPRALSPVGPGSTRPDWQLDERTRTVGRLGVEQAREVLRQARPPEPKQPEPIRKAS